jgi:SpoVK/Ycf46/Vps4 family AAA+-type ATPase
MDDKDLEIVLNGQAPIIALETYDETRALNLLTRHGRSLFEKAWRWTCTDGLSQLGFGVELKNPLDYAKPEDVLAHIKTQDQPHLFVLCDMHPYLDEARVIRYLKDIAFAAQRNDQKIILLSHSISLPPELKRLCSSISLSLPNEEEIMTLVRSEAKRWQQQNSGVKVKTDNDTLDKIVKNLVGLPHQDVRRLAYGAIADDGALTEDDLPEISKAKFKLMDMESVLHFEYCTEHLKSVGGFSNLKNWLALREGVMRDTTGHDSVKGVLLFGVQGGGKSLAAKSIAGQWGLPLLRLDLATLYNKYIGETEKNLREALKLADLMSPCVLWIDEIEKGLAEDSENAVGKRLLGTLLTWMNERKSRVFMVATSNDISELPPELLRKGRFDEVFFIDLPEAEVRKDIFHIHMAKRDIDQSGFDFESLASLSDGFTGAEIEQALVSSLYAVTEDDDGLSQEALERALSQTKPLSVLRAEQVLALRQWAQDRAVLA